MEKLQKLGWFGAEILEELIVKAQEEGAAFGGDPADACKSRKVWI